MDIFVYFMKLQHNWYKLLNSSLSLVNSVFKQK